MTPIINQNGITISDFDSVLSDLETNYKAVYGDDIDLSDSTPDGQKIGIEAKIISDFNEFALSLYNSFDPDFAIGLAMDKILKLNGLKRTQSTKSSVDITLVCSRSISLPIDYKIKDSLNQIWVISEAKELLAGTHIITFYSENFGKYEAQSNTINEFETIILGVDSVTNINPAIVGRNEDTDEEMRIKRGLILQKNSTSSIGAMVGKLYNDAKCNEVIIYENKTDITDIVKDMVSHSIWIICDGGDVDYIAQIIALNSVGVSFKGNIETTYLETITRSNNELFYYTHDVKFDRPNEVELYVKFDVKKKAGTISIDIDFIKQKLSETTFKINESINVTELYSIIYQAGSGFICSSLEISNDDITYVSDILENGFKDRFVISVENISITEI